MVIICMLALPQFYLPKLYGFIENSSEPCNNNFKIQTEKKK